MSYNQQAPPYPSGGSSLSSSLAFDATIAGPMQGMGASRRPIHKEAMPSRRRLASLRPPEVGIRHLFKSFRSIRSISAIQVSLHEE